MAYSTEVVRRARERLAQEKADRESENLQHLHTAYETLPRLRQIDQQLRQTMVAAAKAVFSQGAEAVQAMEQAKQENLGLQRERAALIAAHFEEGFLDDSPICQHCGGSGYVGSQMCECLKELCRQEQKKELALLGTGGESFENFRLEYYPDRTDEEMGVNIRTLMGKTLQTCRRYAFGFTEKAGNLLFSGDTGLGKTFLSACIAKTVADKGYSVMYETSAHLFSKLEQAKFGGSDEARREAERLAQCDLLIVDDLGTEMGSQFVTASLYTLINDRLLSGKSTIISTNMNTEDIGKRYSQQIASRLNGAYKRVPFLGEDIRVRKNWGM